MKKKSITPSTTTPSSQPKPIQATKQSTTSHVKSRQIEVKNVQLFQKENYYWMLIGVALIMIGILLMAGGKSADPNVFLEDEIYSFRRITLAPILIVLGLIVEFYAILKKKAE